MKDKETILKLYEMYIDKIYNNALKKSTISKELSDMGNQLNKSLTKEQQELFDEIIIGNHEQVELVNKEIFVSAFSLAIKLFVEGLK